VRLFQSFEGKFDVIEINKSESEIEFKANKEYLNEIKKKLIKQEFEFTDFRNINGSILDNLKHTTRTNEENFSNLIEKITIMEADIRKIIKENTDSAPQKQEFIEKLERNSIEISLIDKQIDNLKNVVNEFNQLETIIKNLEKKTESYSLKSEKSYEILDEKFRSLEELKILKNNMDKITKKIEYITASQTKDTGSELNNKLYDALTFKMNDLESNLNSELNITKVEFEKKLLETNAKNTFLVELKNINKEIINIKENGITNEAFQTKLNQFPFDDLRNRVVTLESTTKDAIANVLKDYQSKHQDLSQSVLKINEYSDDFREKTAKLNTEIVQLQQKLKNLDQKIMTDSVSTLETKLGNHLQALNEVKKTADNSQKEQEKLSKRLDHFNETSSKFEKELLGCNEGIKLLKIDIDAKHEKKDGIYNAIKEEMKNNFVEKLEFISNNDSNLKKILEIELILRKQQDDSVFKERKLKQIEDKEHEIEEKVKIISNEIEEKIKNGGELETETQIALLKNELKEIDMKAKKTLLMLEDKSNKSELKDLEITQSKFNAKIVKQENSIQEVLDKIIKLDKKEVKGSGISGETSKLTNLTKAIDTIQENSKSLETMVKKMKSEFTTQKEMEKLKEEFLNKGENLKRLDPNHPDIGPIMDSLIMTNDRPYVDCTTLTPMTGNGLVKFERFQALNKLPWDEINDQFIIQEPGVYALNISGILQDAILSVKIASNILEREICSVGSREGIIGVQSPVFVFRSALFQIEDDDNVCETILIEIQAENEDSFIDKNLCFTLFKIAEANGTD